MAFTCLLSHTGQELKWFQSGKSIIIQSWTQLSPPYVLSKRFIPRSMYLCDRTDRSVITCTYRISLTRTLILICFYSGFRFFFFFSLLFSSFEGGKNPLTDPSNKVTGIQSLPQRSVQPNSMSKRRLLWSQRVKSHCGTTFSFSLL